jgi:hypothetical protein
VKQYCLINPQFGLIAAYMAIVLSLQENIDLLLILVKLAIALGTIAIVLVLLFWLRLKKIENRIYQSRKQLRSRFTPKITHPKSPKILPKSNHSSGSTHIFANRPTGNFTATTQRSPQTQVYLSTPYPKLLKRSIKRSSRVRLQWLWAIMIASITGMAIALMQLGNNFISPEYMPMIWLLIGVTLVMSATFIEIA